MRVVFLDRDGVINEKRPDHVKAWDEFVFLPGALDALRMLHANGWLTIIVTNQAIINRGLVSRHEVDEIHHRMARVVERYGGHIESILCCPHRPDELCSCRKPHPGLLLQAAEHYGLPLDQCYLVGDALTDVEAGQTVGCRCVLLQTGHAANPVADLDAVPESSFKLCWDLREAVEWMVLDEALGPRVRHHPERLELAKVS